MNPLTSVFRVIGSGATAYLLASQIRDAKTRPNVLAGFYFAESGSVPFLTKLRDRAAAEGDTWLAERLTKHANDERRHGQIFANALKQMNKEVVDLKAMSESNETSSEERKSPFFDAFYDGFTQAELKPEVIAWPVFLGSTYILEADACKDFVYMARALDGAADVENIQAGILSIAEDEKRHAGYLKEAMYRRYGYVSAEALMNQWRSRKTAALMAMVWNMVERRGQMRTLAQDRVGGEDTVSASDESMELAIAA